MYVYTHVCLCMCMCIMYVCACAKSMFFAKSLANFWTSEVGVSLRSPWSQVPARTSFDSDNFHNCLPTYLPNLSNPKIFSSLGIPEEVHFPTPVINFYSRNRKKALLHSALHSMHCWNLYSRNACQLRYPLDKFKTRGFFETKPWVH